MSEGNIKELLIRHTEKLALGFVLLIIIIYLLSLAAGSSVPEKLKTRTDENILKIQTAMESPFVPEPVQVNYEKKIRDSFDKVPQAGMEPRWFAFKRPYVVRRAVFVRPDEPKHYPPTLNAVAETGQVKLTWEDNSENSKIEILGYTLQRKEGDGNWLKHEDFGKDMRDYKDKTVKPDTRYAYRLTSKARESGTQIVLKDTEQHSQNVLVEIQFNMEFDTTKMSPDPDRDRIYIPVKYKKPGGGEVDSWEWLYKGKMIKVKGFETGWKLKEYGEKKLGPTKIEKFIIIVNSEGKEKRIPEEQAAPPDVPKDPGEEPDKDPEEDPEEPEKPPKKDSGDDGGGWLPPK